MAERTRALLILALFCFIAGWALRVLFQNNWMFLVGFFGLAAIYWLITRRHRPT
jgi:hypothetical protein